MEISAALVKELREKTGVGMMQCKKALQESNGDMKLAIDFLRKQGEETGVKRHGKTAKEGKLIIKIEGGVALIQEVNCETDFVSRNTDFLNFCNNISDLIISKNIDSVENLSDKVLSTGLNVKDSLNDLLIKIGENIGIRRFKRITFDNKTEKAFAYIHLGGKIGILLLIATDKPAVLENEDFNNLGKDITLQIAASFPLSVSREELPTDIVEKEKEIYRGQALNENKPEKIIEKIIDGKLASYYKTVCLVDQPFVKETDKSVKQVIAEVEAKLSCKITVKSFLRYHLGGDA